MFGAHTNMSWANVAMMFLISLAYLTFDFFVVKCWVAPSAELLGTLEAIEAKYSVSNLHLMFEIIWVAKIVLGGNYVVYRFWYDAKSNG